MNTKAALIGGIMAMAAAVAGLTARYLFFPLELPKYWNSIVIAIACTTAVMGRRVVTDVRKQGVHASLPHVLGSIAFAATLAFFAVYALAPKPPSADNPLVDTRLPGLMMKLPAWEVSETGTSWESGQHVLKDPTHEKLFIKVSWAMSGPDVTSLEQYLPQGFMTVVGKETAQVHGHQGQTLSLSIKNHIAFVTVWFCEKDGRAITLFSALDMAADELKALHHRMVGSATCHTEAVTAKPLLPAFKVPADFKEEAADAAQKLFVSQNGAALAVVIGKRQEDLTAHPDLLRDTIEKLFVVDGTTLEWDPVRNDTAKRCSWKARGHSPEGPFLLRATAFYCEGVDASFMALFSTPVLEGDPNEHILDGVVCP